jgi:hypothetical protein
MKLTDLLGCCLLCLALANCSPVVHAQFPDIQVTRPDIPVPAALTTSSSTVMFQFTLDGGSLGASTKPAVQAQMKAVNLNKLTLTAKDGVSDLSFVRTLHILAYVPLKSTSSATTPQASDHQVEIADYERRGNAAIGSTFDVPLPEAVDLLPLVRPDSTEQTKIVVVTSMSGQLPTSQWKVDVTMSLSFELQE